VVDDVARGFFRTGHACLAATTNGASTPSLTSRTPAGLCRGPGCSTGSFYKHRNVVERCFNRLKQCRGVRDPYDKTVTSYQATGTAALLQWLWAFEDTAQGG